MDPIVPPWERCPNCGHHEMSHKHEMGEFICLVFECPCPDPIPEPEETSVEADDEVHP